MHMDGNDSCLSDTNWDKIGSSYSGYAQLGACIQRMVRAIWSKSKFMQGGKFVTCKQEWEFKPYITSLVPLIGHSRAGIC